MTRQSHVRLCLVALWPVPVRKRAFSYRNEPQSHQAEPGGLPGRSAARSNKKMMFFLLGRATGRPGWCDRKLSTVFGNCAEFFVVSLGKNSPKARRVEFFCCVFGEFLPKSTTKNSAQFSKTVLSFSSCFCAKTHQKHDVLSFLLCFLISFCTKTRAAERPGRATSGSAWSPCGPSQ